MIKANELRINNLVKVKISNDARIYTIVNINGLAGTVGLDGVRQGEVISTEKIKPIKLTDDLLMQCGAEESSDGEHFFIGHYGFCLVYDGKDYCVKPLINDPMVIAYCRYLHQLQNLYLALTGKELEIKF